MTEREVKTLLSLLGKFAKTVEDGTPMNPREVGVVNLVAQWVKWYGHDALSMDL